jgi:hypothetical protein
VTKKPPFRIALAAVAAVVLVLVPAAIAGKGKPGGGGHSGSGGGGTISLAPLVNDANGNGLPNWDDTVTFNISTTATTQPWVSLKCTQNGVMVAQGLAGYFDGSLSGRDFLLASPSWTGGAADCTAYLETPTWSVLASTSFHVGA